MNRCVNILGAGLSGLYCALTLARNAMGSNLISYDQSERAQSVMAEGGINGVLDTMGDNDTIAEHIRDTMEGGRNLANIDAVAGMCEEAPDIIKDMEMLGVPFSYNGKGIVQRYFGGQKKRRTAYVRSSTGKMLMSALIDEVRKYEVKGLIKRFDRHELTDVCIEDGELSYILIKNRYTGEKLKLSGMCVMACGGMAGLFDGLTTGSLHNTSDVQALLFEKGLSFANLEFLQYHPTTASIPGKRLLISEAARGEGGRLYILRDSKPWYFMEEKYPELKNLMPRDVVSKEITEVLSMDDTGDTVYLDMTGIKKDIWKNRLTDLRDECIEYISLDPVKQPVPVSPGIHYFMGGILTDIHHRTSVRFLYASGECACQYHGASRLGGNSLLGALYGGKTAAEDILKRDDVPGCDISAAGIDKNGSNVRGHIAKKISKILSSSLPIIRNEESMKKGINDLYSLDNEKLNEKERRRIRLALAFIMSAQNRRESRGAHKRSDHPHPDESMRKTTVVFYKDEMIKTEFCRIGGELL